MRELNEAEFLSIRRLNIKGVSLSDISERIGISKAHVKEVLDAKGKYKPKE